MFNQLSTRLTDGFNKLRGIGKLTDANIQEAIADIRRALIEADVALSVIQEFIERVKTKALGQQVLKSIRPGEAFIKAVNDELVHILGDETAQINLKAEPPVVILVAGLQGAGKTTTVAKLAKHLKEAHQKSVMVVSADVYRPAAIDQLETLAKQVEVDFFKSNPQQKPANIVKDALSAARKQFKDVLILDTAGRLHIDLQMMDEIKALHRIAKPTETLLVVDSMAGQDAANIAKTFNDALALTGVILTKTDGDARGGAALSMRMITGKPIKFIGVGEKTDALEAFHPERIASRILGMGDIVSLVEQAEQKIDQRHAQKLAKKIQKGNRFDFNDFFAQLNQMKKMGGAGSLLAKLPNLPQLPQGKMAGLLDDTLTKKMEAIICSMTLQERAFPAVLNGSRKRRIANGSGTTVPDINKLIKQFTQMQKMMKRFKGNKMMKRMKQMQGMMPDGLDGLF